MAKRPRRRVSEYYNLGRSQPTLDFVDVNLLGDTPVFVDPRALRLLHSNWAAECAALIQDFFRYVMALIRKGHNNRARALLSMLNEPNETHLGLSKGRSRGHAMGRDLAHSAWESLSTSEAAKTGLLEDLEDTILMVKGVSSDIVSDMTTNLIREPLIHYTQQMADRFGIPLSPDVDSGPLWDPAEKRFHSKLLPLPMPNDEKLLLVPKVIVRQRMDYDVDQYFRHYLLVHMQSAEIQANTELVKLLKDGRPRVTKKDLRAKYGSTKEAIVTQTQRNPHALAEYRKARSKDPSPPLDHLSLAASERSAPPNWDALLDDIRAVPVGRPDASNYERAIDSLLTALFYPSLVHPRLQREIHAGRKRIDITYTNAATTGFFFWLGQHYAAPHVFVECKNYSADPANPELDQLSGRFSPSRGQVGLLICRTFNDKNLFLERCRDTANDQRGFVIALDDSDLVTLVEEQRGNFSLPEFRLLRDRFDGLVM